MTKNLKVHFSSKTPEWATPQAFFDKLNAEFDFSLDPCATAQNAKCAKFYTEKDNGLIQSWDGEKVFCNPPYGRVISQWVKKASEAVGGGSGDVDSGSNRYEIFSRIYLWQGRGALYKGTAQIRREQKLSAFSLYGSNF